MPALLDQAPLQVAGESFVLFPERAIFWKEEKALLLSDLHFGKAETFQRMGVRIPTGSFADDLARLESAIERTKSEQIYILGDLFHSTLGTSEEWMEALTIWRSQNAQPWTLIVGNHDRGLGQFPLGDWKIKTVRDALQIRGVELRHAPKKQELATSGLQIAGHLHPMVRSHDHRFPTFIVTASQIILPAFSRFTGGVNFEPEADEKFYAVVEDKKKGISRLMPL